MRVPFLSKLALIGIGAGLSALFGLVACTSVSQPDAPVTPTGSAAIVITDSPSDAWSAVEVVVKAITLVDKTDLSKEVIVFNGSSAKVNLVDLDEVGELLAKADVPAGTYGQIKLTIDTGPGKIHLVKNDGSVVPEPKIHVIGEVNDEAKLTVRLSPDLVVAQGTSNVVQVDFNLGHPLFLFETVTGDVVINFQLLHKPHVGALSLLQFHPAIGQVTNINTGQSTFTITNRHNRSLTYGVDAQTIWWNANTRPVTAGSYSGLSTNMHVLVQSNLKNDGTLYARRVFYATDPSTIYRLISPVGHVVNVDTTNSTFDVVARIPNDTSDPTFQVKTIAVTPNTQFLWHQDALIGTGVQGLGQLMRGFKVHVEVADPQDTTLTATRVNVQHAVDEGIISGTTTTNFTFAASAPKPARSYDFSSAFTWWLFANPGQKSTSIGDFRTAVASSQGIPTRGATSLLWPVTGSLAWQSGAMILLPASVPDRRAGDSVATITSAYNGGTHQMGMTYTPTGGVASVKTLTLSNDPTDQVQTLVWKITRNGLIVTTTYVAPDAWASELTTATTSVWASAVPTAAGTLKAYTIVVYVDQTL